MARTFHVVLLEPEIPQNAGNIARLCAATECELHLVGRLGFHLDEPRLRRAGLDYWPYVRLHRHIDLESCRQAIGPAPEWCFSARAERSFLEAPLPLEAMLLFGNESRGLPDRLVHGNPACLRIPMLEPRVRSLNLATAVGIVVYEGLRQNGLLGKPPEESA